MEHLEMVEKLREKTGVTYEEAKEALEKSQWDMLDAIVYLEKQGKVKEKTTASYSTQYEQSEQFEKASSIHSDQKEPGIFNRFFEWCCSVIKRGNENHFHVTQNGSNVMTISVTVFVILLVCFSHIVLPAMVIGLFFGLRYSFSGREIENVTINKAMDKASETAEKIKKSFDEEPEQE